MILEGNRNVLKKRFRSLYEALLSMEQSVEEGGGNRFFSEKGQCEILTDVAKNGEIIIKCRRDGREFYLNSRYNPAGEAEKYMEEEIAMPEESVLTMIGLANGSFAKSLLAQNKRDFLCIIYEPEPLIFLQTLKNIDLSDILSDQRTVFIVEGINEDLFQMSLSKSIQIYNKTINHHIVLPKYGELFPSSCESVVATLNEQYDRVRAETNTAVDCGRKIYQNGVYNMRYLPGCRSGRDYVKLFPKDLPAIVVSAGPSLEKNVELLKKAKNKALIVVVDTAIPKVMEKGIMPDLVISVDYRKSLKHFEVDHIGEVPFLGDADLNFKVLDFVQPKHLIFASSESLVWDKLFRKAGREIWTVDTGGSVSTTAIANMIAWGFHRIILVGQDLALTDNKVHAGDQAHSADKGKWETTYVKGIDGGEILTRKDYCIYIRWIEDVGYRYRDLELIDATEGGALKKNTTVMTLAEAIDRYCTKEYDIYGMLTKPERLFEGDQKNLVSEAFADMKKDLKNLRRFLVNGVADCRMGRLMLARGDYNVRELKRINASIGALDEKIATLDERMELVKFAAGAEIEFSDDFYEEDADDIKEAIRMYDKSGRYYQSLADAVIKMVEIIDDCEEQFRKKEE